jgi:hypothetical protein
MIDIVIHGQDAFVPGIRHIINDYIKARVEPYTLVLCLCIDTNFKIRKEEHQILKKKVKTL